MTMVVADFHDLPFSDNYFDVIFVASSVHHTRFPEQVLREMMRALRPSGIPLGAVVAFIVGFVRGGRGP